MRPTDSKSGYPSRGIVYVYVYSSLLVDRIHRARRLFVAGSFFSSHFLQLRSKYEAMYSLVANRTSECHWVKSLYGSSQISEWFLRLSLLSPPHSTYPAYPIGTLVTNLAIQACSRVVLLRVSPSPLCARVARFGFGVRVWLLYVWSGLVCTERTIARSIVLHSFSFHRRWLGPTTHPTRFASQSVLVLYS
jgi:hypothetical protein